MKIRFIITLVFTMPMIAFTMPQRVTEEELEVVIYQNAEVMHKSMIESLKTGNIAVGALKSGKGLLKLYFWEDRTKQTNITPPRGVSIRLNITGVVENVPIEPLSHVKKKNMFELEINPDNINKTSFIIQTRMNEPGQGDYAWKWILKLKKSIDKQEGNK